MKCIIKALQETNYKPRAKWWGYITQDRRYLMRYHHTMLTYNISTGEIISKFQETRTDKVGVDFAIDYLVRNKHLSNDTQTKH